MFTDRATGGRIGYLSLSPLGQSIQNNKHLQYFHSFNYRDPPRSPCFQSQKAPHSTAKFGENQYSDKRKRQAGCTVSHPSLLIPLGGMCCTTNREALVRLRLPTNLVKNQSPCQEAAGLRTNRARPQPNHANPTKDKTGNAASCRPDPAPCPRRASGCGRRRCGRGW